MRKKFKRNEIHKKMNKNMFDKGLNRLDNPART